MPVIVIGADTTLGAAIVPSLASRTGELRVFVSDGDIGEAFRGVAKVAVGDVSDGSHVGGAAMGAFCAIVVSDAAHDDRERAFASNPVAVFERWADGLGDAGIARVIVVGARRKLLQPDPLERIGDYLVVDTTGKTIETIQNEVKELEARD